MSRFMRMIFTNHGIINEKILLSNITNLYQEISHPELNEDEDMDDIEGISEDEDTYNHLNQFFQIQYL